MEQKNDEIDLIELIKVLWDKKIWIIVSAVICTALAGAYAFTAKEQWTSKAEVTLPQLSDLDSYFSLQQEYTQLVGSSKIDEDKLSQKIYSQFELVGQSLDHREQFFAQSEVYKTLSESKDENQKRKILFDLVRTHLTYTKPDLKKEPGSKVSKFTFFAETPLLAQDTLKAFLNYTNQKAYQTELNNFTLVLNNKIDELKYELKNIEQNLSVSNDIQLKNLNKALNIAKAAGIKDYSKSFELNGKTVTQTLVMSDAKNSLSNSTLNDVDYLFMLGERYLQAQIDTISKQDVVYPSSYYEIKNKLDSFYALSNKVKTVKANMFAYQSSPDYPVAKDKPRKAIILLIGLLAGAFLSSLAIVVLSLFKRD